MALCANFEGWGPISNERQFDLTPCFENATLLGGTLIILFLGSLLRNFQLRNYPIRPKNAKTRRWLAVKLVS